MAIGVLADGLTILCSLGHVPERARMSSISTGTIGAINELRIASNMMALGWGIFRCLSPNNGTDLIAMKGRTILKVQCKSSAKGQYQNIRAGNNDLLVLVGLDGELRYRARTKHVAKMFPACGLVRKPKPRKPPLIRHHNSHL